MAARMIVQGGAVVGCCVLAAVCRSSLVRLRSDGISPGQHFAGGNFWVRSSSCLLGRRRNGVRHVKNERKTGSGRVHLQCLSPGAEEEQERVPELQVPQEWVSPAAAAQEAEWLRGALHKWLDDEFCPEPANEEISRRCAKVYYYCLLEQQLDIGDILMQMVRDLETFSFKESFHGAFSSANAAIDLITRRMTSMETSQS